MTAVQAARERLEAYVLSYASPSLIVGDSVAVAHQVEQDRASGYPPEVLRRLVNQVVSAVRDEETNRTDQDAVPPFQET